MKKTLLALSVALALGSGAAGIALAGPDHHPMHRHGHAAEAQHDRLVDRMARRLDLTDEQRGRIGEAMAARAPELREKAKALREARRDLRTLGLSEPFDRERAAELAQRQAELSAGIALAHAERMSEVYAVLTPEQREKISEWRTKRDGFKHRDRH